MKDSLCPNSLTTPLPPEENAGNIQFQHKLTSLPNIASAEVKMQCIVVYISQSCEHLCTLVF